MEAPAALPTREAAWQLLCRYTTSEALRKHALAVEAVMRRLAEAHGDDPHLFGLVGLLHDFDYEKWPEVGRHTVEGARILRAEGYPPVVVEAVLSHVTENGIPRDTLLKRAIYAADELTGFVVAVALVKGRRLSAVTPESVLKKLKDKSFARGVNRQDVVQGAEALGVPLADLVAFVVDALKPVASQIGLEP
ncbi:MAG: HDIG domain-containing protein [Actinomycetia bacterium]|nr:HDIG domain-containing protein [Actinomycetes bacterium]